MGVGQVVEHDRVRHPEQRHLLLSQPLLQFPAVFPQQVADAVERLAGQRPRVGVEAEQFRQGAVTLQPAAGFPLTAGVDHPRRDDRRGNARIPQAETASLEDAPEAEILQRPQTDPFRPDRHRVLVLHAVEIHPGNGRIRPPGKPQALCPKLPRQMLRVLLDGLRLGKQCLPPGQDLLAALGDAEPQLPGHVPMGAEIEQRLLPDPAVDADIAHQAVGLSRPARLVGVGLGRLDEHRRLRSQPGPG